MSVAKPRRRYGWLALALVLAMLPGLALARVEVHQFATPEQESIYKSLIDELRCPKCQNQNLADSDAPLAQDLRQKVFEQLQAGQNRAEIKDYMIERYGDFVTYKPPLKWQTLILWGLPWLVVVVAGLWIVRRLSGRVAGGAQTLSEAEQARLTQLLADDEASTISTGTVTKPTVGEQL